MNPHALIQDIAVVAAAAGAALFVARRLGLPPVVGFLVTGLLIGPHTPPYSFIRDVRSLEALAEVGVVVLLFALGIEFNLTRLARAGLRALLCALAEAAVMIGLGYFAAGHLGWDPMESLLFGGVAAVTGTAVVARTLLERAKTPEGWEELVAGMLIAEDVVAVVMIAFFASAGGAGGMTAADAGALLVRFAGLVVVLLVVGLIVLPRLARAAAERGGVDETRSLVVMGICFGVAAVTHALGYSAALGAFLAGAMASMSGEDEALERTVSPFRDVFGAVFFVSIGMLIDPAWVVQNWAVALALSAGLVAARAVVNTGILTAAGEAPDAALRAGIVMLPIGEFSFILAQLGRAEGITKRPIEPLAVLFCLATTLASAVLIRAATRERVAAVLPRGVSAALERRRVSPASGAMALAWPLMRPSITQIVMNLAALTGYFWAAAALEARYALWRWPGVVWAGATMLALPFLNALVRKTQAVALIILEVLCAKDPAPPSELRPRLTRAFVASSTALVALWFFAVTKAMLPAWPAVVVPLALIAAVTLALWRRTSRLYSLIQDALRKSVAARERRTEAGALVAAFAGSHGFDDARVSAFRLSQGDGACGKTLSQLDLRARTGATVLQVKNAAGVSVSPGAATVVSAGDELLLVGQPEDLEKAARLLHKGLAS